MSLLTNEEISKMSFFDDDKFRVINGVRFRPAEIVAYYHEYEPGYEYEIGEDKKRKYPETSTVVLKLEGGAHVEIKPCDDCHTPEILRKLDKMCGIAR
jgi:hypothetical protein